MVKYYKVEMAENVDALIEAAKLASNYDVFVRIDKTVEMNFTFHGLTVS